MLASLFFPSRRPVYCANEVNDSTPEDGCFECTNRVDNGDGTFRVTINFSGCKGSAISWACVIGADCGGSPPTFNWGNTDCHPKAVLTGGINDVNEKVDGVTEIDVDVLNGATTLLLNMHDGQNVLGYGNVCAGGKPGVAATNTNGNGNEPGNYCQVEVDLSTCPRPPTAPIASPPVPPPTATAPVAPPPTATAPVAFAPTATPPVVSPPVVVSDAAARCGVLYCIVLYCIVGATTSNFCGALLLTHPLTYLLACTRTSGLLSLFVTVPGQS